MPSLDVTDVLLSPEFQDFVTVIRRTQVVNDYGEVSTTDRAFENIGVVVTTVAPNDLQRGDAEQNQPRSFTIISGFRLQGPTVTTQPDLVIWLGDKYIIDHVEPYTRYGRGLVEAQMSSIDHSDQSLA